MEISLSAIAEKLGLERTGDDMVVTGVNTLDKATENDISFLVNPKYVKDLETTRAGCIITSEPYADKAERVLVSENIYMDLARIVEMFATPQGCMTGISDLAYVHPDATVHDSATIYPFAFVGANAVIGENSSIFAGCYVGENASIGKHCIVYPNAVIMGGIKLGNNVIIQPGAVIGGDGYGYAQTPVGHMKIPQVGIVELADNVEIGSNTTIDRAALDVTKIGRGTKIDNLVQIGHNVEVGDHCLIIGQVGIGGSTKVGHGVVLAGQVGIADNSTIGDKAMIGAQSGLRGKVEPGSKLVGSPAIEVKQFMKAAGVCLPKLPDLFKRVKKLEKQLEAALQDAGSGQSDE